MNQKWTQLILGPLKSQCRVKLRPGKLSVTSEGRCHRIPCRLRAALAYQTGEGGAQLGQIEARPFVWVTVKTLICMQAYRPLGSTGLTLSHTLIYVLISPSVLFSSSLPPFLPLSSHHFHFLSPHFSPSQTTCFFCCFFLLFSISFSSLSPCLVKSPSLLPRAFFFFKFYIPLPLFHFSLFFTHL